MEGGKDIEQKKGLGKGQILSSMEGVHSRRGYMGKQRELGKCRRAAKEAQRRI